MFRGVWVQPAIRRDAIDDDRCISENAEKALRALGVRVGNASVN
jgi:hypothetical protein